MIHVLKINSLAEIILQLIYLTNINLKKYVYFIDIWKEVKFKIEGFN